jgi:putative FmdB family regulatory protein
MPIYEYACSACGHHLEVMQSIKDAPLSQCPKCKKRKLKKLVSAAGFQLKGTGWYVTDFRNKGKPAPDKAANDKEDGGKAEKSDEKSEKKEAAKAEPSTESTKSTDKPEKKKKKKTGD